MELNTEKIKTLLSRYGWNESDLAKKMKVSRQYLNRIMIGKRGISFKGVDKMANVLGIDGKDLIK
jgi:transcriptional regulator with XRE-family HTH domain